MEINGKNYRFNENKTEINFNDLGINDQKLKNIFDYFDTNKDGKLSSQELDNAFSVFTSFDDTDGVSDKKLSDKELDTGILSLPKSARVSVDAMKAFITKLVVINNGKNVAKNLHDQISGLSWYKNTVQNLKSINKHNVVEVLSSYPELSKGETLASAVDNELILDTKEVKEYICKPLVERAKQAGVKCADYTKLDKIEDVNNFIKSTLEAIKKVETEKFMDDLSKDLPFDPSDYPQYDNVMHYVTKGAKSHGNNLSEDELKNIVKMVLLECKKYNISDISPVIAQILNTETGGYVFNERSMDPDLIYKGVMQVDYDTCCCILGMREPKTIKGKTYGTKSPETYSEWHNKHFSQDDALIQEIREKYPTPSELYEAIKTDVELGFEVGILAFKAKLSETKGDVRMAIDKYCGSNYKCDLDRVPKTYNVKTND